MFRLYDPGGVALVWRQGDIADATGAGSTLPRIRFEVYAREAFVWGRRRPVSAGADVSVALSGQAVTTSTGTLTLGIVVPMSGQAVTASAGTLTASGDSNVTVALSGQAVTASAGTLVPSHARALSGQSVTVSTGTVSPFTGLFRDGNPRVWIVDARQRYVQVDARTRVVHTT